MVLDPSTCGWIRQHLQQEREAVLGRWTERVVTNAGGGLTDAEIRSSNAELLNALLRGLRDGDSAAGVDLAEPATAELRATLTDLSRSRARLGYTPSETAMVVFALKEAVTDTADVADPDQLAAVLRFSRFVDEMGLFTFEAYNRAREELILEQNQQLLELSTPVVKL